MTGFGAFAGRLPSTLYAPGTECVMMRYGDAYVSVARCGASTMHSLMREPAIVGVCVGSTVSAAVSIQGINRKRVSPNNQNWRDQNGARIHLMVNDNAIPGEQIPVEQILRNA